MVLVVVNSVKAIKGFCNKVKQKMRETGKVKKEVMKDIEKDVLMQDQKRYLCNKSQPINLDLASMNINLGQIVYKDSPTHHKPAS